MKEHIRRFGGIGIVAFAVYLAVRYWAVAERLLCSAASALYPLVLGCVMAYTVNILMVFYERKLLGGIKSSRFSIARRPLGIILAYLSLFVIIAVLFNMILPELIDCMELLGQKLPYMITDALEFLSEVLNIDGSKVISDAYDEIMLELSNIDWQDSIGKVMESFGSAFNMAFGLLSSIASVSVTFFLALVFSIYVLFNKESIASAVCALLNAYTGQKTENKIRHVFSVLDTCFHRFIVGQCTEAVILGSLCALGMMLLKLPYATMIGALIGFTALIPVAGAYIGAAVGAVMIFTYSPVKALIFIIFLIVLQQFEGNVIYPRVVGSSIGLPGILVLAAITVGGGMMGVLGMLIGVPLTAAVYQLVSEDIVKRRDLKRE